MCRPLCLWEWGVCNTDCYMQLCLCSWGRVGVATQTVLCAVLSVCGNGGCATQTVTCDCVCGVGVGWGLQHRPCYVPSCLSVGMGCVKHRLLHVIVSVRLGWGGGCNTDCVVCRPVSLCPLLKSETFSTTDFSCNRKHVPKQYQS